MEAGKRAPNSLNGRESRTHADRLTVKIGVGQISTCVRSVLLIVPSEAVSRRVMPWWEQGGITGSEGQREVTIPMSLTGKGSTRKKYMKPRHVVMTFASVATCEGIL